MSRTRKAYRLIQDYHLLAYEALDSTNEEAKRLASGGGAHGAVIWAKEQTAGRGRMGRTWISKPGNLYCSLLLKPPFPLEQSAQLSFLSAVAVVDALSPLVLDEKEIRCKWPNDVLLDGRKIAGILLESFTTQSEAGEKEQWVVVGVGVNIEHFPEDTLYPTTCLRAAGVELVSAKIVLGRFVEQFIARYDQWVNEGFAPIRAQWLNYAYGLGESLTVRHGDEQLQGAFTGVSETGELLLEPAQGGQITIHSGDVFFNTLNPVTTRAE